MHETPQPMFLPREKNLSDKPSHIVQHAVRGLVMQSTSERLFRTKPYRKRKRKLGHLASVPPGSTGRYRPFLPLPTEATTAHRMAASDVGDSTSQIAPQPTPGRVAKVKGSKDTSLRSKARSFTEGADRADRNLGRYGHLYGQ